MKKEIAGIPVWIYAIGAAVVIGGYLWIKHQQSSTSAGTPGQGTGGQGKSTSSISEQITEWQSSPGGGGGGGRHMGPGPGPESERDALQHWTGSEHPWTWLHTHSRKSV